MHLRRLCGYLFLISNLGACMTVAGTIEPLEGCGLKELERIYFGSETPLGPVTDDQWSTFLAEVVTSRFPEGFTVLHANGQWRGKDGVVVRETSRVVEIVHPRGREGREAASHIAREYRERFQQEAVMIVRTEADVCF